LICWSAIQRTNSPRAGTITVHGAKPSRRAAGDEDGDVTYTWRHRGQFGTSPCSPPTASDSVKVIERITGGGK